MGNLYAMISTKSSNFYTKLAIESFFKNTKLRPSDKFYLIDNDNEGIYNNLGIDVIKNTQPKSFAKNVNDMIELANGLDLVLLSNDVVFTPNWIDALNQYPNILLLPSCNQTHLYTSSDESLELLAFMDIDRFNNQHPALNEIVNHHRRSNRAGFFERLLMGFYVFRLPASIYKKIGMFDEQFGVGGGEDIDYRLRCIQQNVPVKYYSHSYLLHFAGKSTWDGPEKQQEVQERNAKYMQLFSNKWGSDIANLCLVGGNPLATIEKYNLHIFINSQEYSRAINTVLNTTNKE